MVSFSVSPFVAELVAASLKPMTLAPRRIAAVSKLKRVRVEELEKERTYDFTGKDVAVGVLLELACSVEQ